MWSEGEYLNKSAAIAEGSKCEKEVVLWYDTSNIRGRKIITGEEKRMKKNRLLRMSVVTGLILALAALPLMAACAKPAEEAKYPSSPIMVIIPWPAGGRSDLESRVWAPFLEKELGVPVVVANHPGGGGVVGSNTLAASRPDGYTISQFSLAQVLAQYTKKPPLDFGLFVPVFQTSYYPFTVVVNAESPWQTLQDFITYAKANPGKLKGGTAGAGTGIHLGMVAFAKAAGINIQPIHYKGDAPAVTATAGKEVDFNISPMAANKAMAEAGKLRVLALLASERSSLYPDIPTARDQGLDFDVGTNSYIATRKGVPAERIALLEKAMEKVLTTPEVIEILQGMGVDVSYKNSQDTARIIEAMDATFRPVVIELGLAIGLK